MLRVKGGLSLGVADGCFIGPELIAQSAQSQSTHTHEDAQEQHTGARSCTLGNE